MQTWRSVSLLVLVSACMLSATAASPSEGQPTKDYTYHEAHAEKLAILRREYGGAYKQVGHHGAWDEAAAKFLDDWAIYQAYSDASPLYRDLPVPKITDLVAEGRAVAVDAHCDDPLVMACYGFVLDIADEPEAALPVLLKSAKALAASQYADSWCGAPLTGPFGLSGAPQPPRSSCRFATSGHSSSRTSPRPPVPSGCGRMRTSGHT